MKSCLAAAQTYRKGFMIVLLIMDIGKVLWNTFVIELLPALISTAVCMMVGYGLARFDFKGKKLVSAGVILTIIVPQQVISTSLYTSYRSLCISAFFVSCFMLPPPNSQFGLPFSPKATMPAGEKRQLPQNTATPAFKPVEQYYDPSVIWLPKSLTLENFKIVLLIMDIGKVLWNTFVIELLLVKVRNALQPSMAAASCSSFGSPVKNCL